MQNIDRMNDSKKSIIWEDQREDQREDQAGCDECNQNVPLTSQNQRHGLNTTKAQLS